MFVIPKKTGIQRILAKYDLPELIEKLLYIEVNIRCKSV